MSKVTEHLGDALSDDDAHIKRSSFERGADIVLSDDSISRVHAMIFYDHSGVGIIDMASTNGTLVNGERVKSAMLVEGDAIAIGHSVLVLKLS